jgi:hypothetical protein
LNRKHKRKYDKAVAEILEQFDSRGLDVPAIERYVSEVYAALGDLDVTVKRGSLRPPK